MRGHAGGARGLERAPLGRPARLAGAQPGDRAGAAGGGLGRRRTADARHHPDPPARLDRTVGSPATCCRSSGATRWSSPCTRPPASPASSPAPRCRSPPPSAAASRAGSTSRRASWRSSSSAPSPSSRSRTQALYLGFQGSTIAYQLAHLDRDPDAQRPAARAARADRALPAPRRLADRQPPRRVEPAARRDPGHRADRDPRPRRCSDNRGLRLAPHPRSSLAGGVNHRLLRFASGGGGCRHIGAARKESDGDAR